ncbi:GNAT family N-acetyltransferase [Embleya sp. NBC_00896]|uniref:GNAT family N-acetyltransferase n=1 Tax=Embleya sp. NBC_00896 TaxID=2975961 RepID=UPI003866B1B9|nr:GNAT family N-acetyltransferase [Embleya sp. NBC_00896]
MTTTLRPAGPGRDGVYSICANGRAVGGVHLTPMGPWGAGTGWILHIQVLPSRRRRGHACVAMLAAEEIMRVERCTRMAAAVPEGNRAATGLVEALGYVPDSRRFAAPVRTTGLPSGVRMMDTDERAEWCAAELLRHAASLREAGWAGPAAEARARARLDHPAAPAPYTLGDGAVVWVAHGVILALAAPTPDAAATLLRAAGHVTAVQGLPEMSIDLPDVPDGGHTKPCTAAGFAPRTRYWGKPIL